MKNLLFTLFFLFGVFNAATAQHSKGLEFGASFGYNGATINNVSDHSPKLRSGFNGALSAEYYFSNVFGVKLKTIYDQKGWNNGIAGSVNIYGVLTTRSTDYALNYITFPLTANLHLGKTKNWYINFGPYVGILLDAKEGRGYSYSVKQYFKNVDKGIAYGVGVKFPLTKKNKLFIEVDGQSGLGDIYKFYYLSSPHNLRGSVNVGVNF